jgi:Uma2 family endonuclease
MDVAQKPKPACLPLESGDRLTRAEFERRYATREDIRKAELVEGVVYVASPVRTEQHGQPHFNMNTWLGVFVSRVPGVFGATDATVRLDDENELQPDLFLARDREHGGNCAIDDDGYLVGAPELVVEVTASSASYDLGAKMEAYRRNGVREYIVWQMHEQRIDWFRLERSAYKTVAPGASGIIESAVFPGLRLDVPAMLRGDLAAVLNALSSDS